MSTPRPLLEGICVCYNYGDFLFHTLPSAKLLFDKVIVVTHPSDTRTQLVCEFNDVEYVTTEVFHENGDPFNKGKAINEGLKKLSKQGWVVHFDSDIWFPLKCRKIYDRVLQWKLDPTCIYGVDRMMCDSYAEWIKFLNSLVPIYHGDVFVNFPFRLGHRLSNEWNEGYEPIGYFQMWNPKGSNVWWYPTEHKDAARGDVQFALRWSKKKRHNLAEWTVIHLDSGKSPMASNWQGRTTPLFGIKQYDIERPFKKKFDNKTGAIEHNKDCKDHPYEH